MKISYNTLYILLVFVLTACSDQDLNDFIADNILYHLNTSTEDVSTSPIEQSHKISVNTNTDWIAETGESWIVIDNAAGDSKTELSFKTLANDTPNERIGKISIYCFGKHKKDITVRQGKVSLNINEDSLSYSSLSSEQTISINTEGIWRISSSDEWLKFSSSEGFGNSTVTITVDELMSVKNRKATVTIIDQSFQKQDISVIQKGKYLSTGISKVSFLASGENVENISFETDGIVEFVCDSWINITKTNDNSANIKATENTSGKTKSGFIYLSLRGVSDCEPVAIALHQAPVKTTAEAVDLGLSVKWSSLNLGASGQWEFGDHYLPGVSPDFQYNCYDYYISDNIVEQFKDTAYEYWGGHWRLPSNDEWHELFTKCNDEYLTYSELYKLLGEYRHTLELFNEETGYKQTQMLSNFHKLTGPNGNYIILPIPGHWWYLNNELKSQAISENVRTSGIDYRPEGYYMAQGKHSATVRPQTGQYYDVWNIGIWTSVYMSVRPVWDK